MQDDELLSRCLKKDVVAENQLYHRFAPKMFGVCLRYGGNEMEAEEILQDGFLNLFRHLSQFRFEGSLDGWIRRIFVNTAINYYKKNLKFSHDVELAYVQGEETLQEDALSVLTTKEMLSTIQRLPIGYRTIFNMFVMEDYTHKEIAIMLGISEGTSKSQLHRAKAMIKRMLNEREKYYING